MSNVNDGGPAFPVSTRPEEDGVGYGHQDGAGTYLFGGMTLRDAMAMAVSMDPEFSVKWATALVGREQPNEIPTDPEELREFRLQQIDWWAEAEAAYRYRVADAMLKVREVDHE